VKVYVVYPWYDEEECAPVAAFTTREAAEAFIRKLTPHMYQYDVKELILDHPAD